MLAAWRFITGAWARQKSSCQPAAGLRHDGRHGRDDHGRIMFGPIRGEWEDSDWKAGGAKSRPNHVQRLS